MASNDIFGRVYELTIALPIKAVKATNPSDVITTDGKESTPTSVAKDDFVTVPEDRVVFTEHQMTGKVRETKKLSNSQSDATFSLYNLTKEQRDMITDRSSVFLKAGYEDRGDLPLVYVGSISRSTTKRSGPDEITTIYCKTAGVARPNLRVSRNGTANESVLDVLNWFMGVVTANGIIKGGVQLSPDSKASTYKYPKGKRIYGNLFLKLDEMCEHWGLKNYLAAGALFIESKDNIEYVGVIPIEEGNVKGIITDVKDGTTVLPAGDDEGKVKRRIKLTTYLDGNIDLNQKVNILYEPYKGSYKVLEVVHTMDLEGNKWETTIEAQEVL